MVEVRRSSRSGSVSLDPSQQDQQQHQQQQQEKNSKSRKNSISRGKSNNSNSNSSDAREHRNSFDPSLDEAFRKRVGKLDNKKVLIVDDDYVTRNVLGKLLEKMGYEPSTADGGRKGLEMMSSEDFQFVLIDVMMPEMDGYTLMRMFKQAAKRDIQCIMMSGSEDPETASKCFQVGAEDFLQKPIREEILRQRIDKCMQYRNRKIREHMYEEALEQEAQLKESLSEQIERNRLELEDYRKRVAESIETPIQGIMSTITELVNGKFEEDQYKVGLMTMLKALGETDLYKPAFVDYIRKADIDEQTRQWLISQYTKEDIISTPTSSYDGSFGRRLSLTPEKMNDIAAATAAAEAAAAAPMNGEIAPELHRKHIHHLERPHKKKVTLEEPDHSHRRLPFDLESYVPTVDLQGLDYDALSFSRYELQRHVMYMFHDLDLFEHFSIDHIKLWRFLEQLSGVYHDNHYHNFTHAVDVTQFSYMLIKTEKLSEMLDSFDKYVLCVSALCHDIDHPGVNNTYLVNAYDDLALRYNDKSVLENHHAASAFRMFMDPNINILEGLSAEGYREFRKAVVEVILATDMSNHFSITSKFETRIATGPLSRDHPGDRLLLMRILMKCADINNMSRPFDVARKWAERVTEEFTHQGDLERTNGLSVSPHMDRHTLNFPKSQRDFADFIALPLFKLLSDAVHGVDFIYQSVLSHRNQWDKLYQEQSDGARNQLGSNEVEKMDTENGEEKTSKKKGKKTKPIIRMTPTTTTKEIKKTKPVIDTAPTITTKEESKLQPPQSRKPQPPQQITAKPDQPGPRARQHIEQKQNNLSSRGFQMFYLLIPVLIACVSILMYWHFFRSVK